FGILLHECSREQGLEIAERIRVAIGTPPNGQDGHGVAISASVGLAATGIWGYGLQRLCKEADAALYRAKRNGRHRVVAGADHLAEPEPGPLASRPPTLQEIGVVPMTVANPKDPSMPRHVRPPSCATTPSVGTGGSRRRRPCPLAACRAARGEAGPTRDDCCGGWPR
ncbi:MAG TPA: diguanylate cyclase, partial [Rhodanobacter sp.]|nr:diguanylate cyclase [Rhodanobacter sp.]